MNANDELNRLVDTLHRTQRRIQELTDGSVDSVVLPSGIPFLLHPAQEALRRREADQQRLAAILDVLPAHIALLDKYGVVVAVNAAWRRFAAENGYSGSDSGVGSDYLAICDFADRTRAEGAAEVGQALRAILAGERRHYEREDPCHAPNEQRWFRMIAVSLDHPRHRGAVVVHVDVTARKNAEQRRRLLIKALDAAALPVVITDAGGTIEWVNEAFADSTGYTAEEAIGRNPRELVQSGRHDAAFYRALWDTILAGKVWSGEMINRRKDGSLYPEHLSITPVRDSDGVIAHFIAIKRDLTGEKQREAQLQQSQRMEAIGQLTGGIAHDFNNLLTVILGNGELLFEHLTEDDPLQSLAGMIVAAARRGAELTHHLLAFARRQALEPKVIDANRLIDDLQDLLGRTLGEHIVIEWNPGDAPLILVDPAQLESALLNLALNARDAMQQGGRLIIETAAVELDADYAARDTEIQPGRYLRIALSDTGTGIPAPLIHRLFEPFYTTKEKGKGTGLGLAMVYGFVKQSGGHVAVYSEPGLGTTFKLYLPNADSTIASAPVSETTVKTGVTGGSETILLVEDDELVRRFGRDRLTGLGYRVFTAADGPEALAILREHEDIDLLFSDIVMPGGMNGRELADAARAIRPRISVLYTSGYTENVLVHHGRLDDGIELLGKPYRGEELARKVRAVLDGIRLPGQ